MTASFVSASLELKVQFYDVDAMKVVWHGNYVKYFEQARCMLLDKINYNYPQMEESGYIWPVIDLSVRYISPAYFSQIISLTANLVEYENRLKITYLLIDKEHHTRICKGYTVQVAVDAKSGEMCFVSPEILQQRIFSLGKHVNERD